MLTSHAVKKVIVGAALAMLVAAPAIAQSYSTEYGSGNIVNLPLAQKSNGAAGIGTSAYRGAGSYVYASSGSSAFGYAAPRHTVNRARTSGAPDLSIRSQH